MVKNLLRWAAPLVGGVLLSNVAVGAIYNVITDATKSAAGDREVHVLIGQAEIKPDIVGSNVAAAAGGGLLMALIDAGIESSRTKKAEEAIQPLRAALTGYDFDEAVKQATQNGLSKVEWLRSKPIVIGKDSSETGKLALLDAASTDQIAVFDYSYDTLPNFTGVRVSVNIQILNKAVPAGRKPNARLAPKNTAYTGNLISVVEVPGAGSDPIVNLAKLTENNAAVTRQALELALEQVKALIPRALSTTPEEALAIKKSKDKKTTVAGYFGKPAGTLPDGSALLFGDVRIGNAWAFDSWVVGRMLP